LNKKILVICLVGIFILIFSSGCGKGKNEANFNSSSIDVLQKEVPFNIVVPKYFPQDVKTEPGVILGPGELSYIKGSTWIDFTYYQTGGNIALTISQVNAFINDAQGESSIYFSINGVQILEDTHSLRQPGTTIMLNGFTYGWNQNGIHLTVCVYGYDKDECRKVIKSMIKE
jgi:hypothetical protein